MITARIPKLLQKFFLRSVRMRMITTYMLKLQ